MDSLPDTRDEIGAFEVRTASQKEIQEFGDQLAGFGISFSEVADNCPRQERTLSACRRVLDYARSRPELLEKLVETGRLPMGELAAGSGTDKKSHGTAPKIFGGHPVGLHQRLRDHTGHLCQIAPAKGGGGK